MNHEFEADFTVFSALESGIKAHDTRQGGVFSIGDCVLYHETEDGIRSGRRWLATVGYVTSLETPCALSPEGLAPGHSIFSLIDGKSSSGSVV